MPIDKKDIIVVIPTQKTDINHLEKASLEQVLRVLKDYKIVFVVPQSIVFNPRDLIPGNKVLEQVGVIKFDDEYFKSVLTYSKLLLTKEFYEPFRDYRYMFLYQMDAYVFYDGLLEWSQKGWDYIGAAWIKEDEKFLMQTMYKGKYSFLFSFMRFVNRTFFGKTDYAIGNGGMSLRNISKSIRVLSYFSFLSKRWLQHEDVFWSMAIPMLYPFFRVPNLKEGLSFAFEQNP